MRETLAIQFKNVTKIYHLHGSQKDQLIHILGLKRFGIGTKTPAKEFYALSDISLDVPVGHRIGIIGRNGAGKTTLLKLICGNFLPTLGSVTVNGNVQALMNMGLGFHPEYTGRENVEASLLYNGLSKDNYLEAMESIIEFCELDDFLDQPFKTYSLGMQARLMFATTTAIRPDILIVDEVLGAGDAYFVAKSKVRVENMVGSGCTMLLVSHSMQQILELCEEAIWLDHGRIHMQDESLLVVKAYEEFLHGPIKQISIPKAVKLRDISPDSNASSHDSGAHKLALTNNAILQEPVFRPHSETPRFPLVNMPLKFNYIAKGGISRWDSQPGAKFCGFTMLNEQGESNQFMTLTPVKFIFTFISEREGEFTCRYAINIYDLLGKSVTSIKSPADNFHMLNGEMRSVELCFNPMQIGPGEYVLSISIHDYDDLERFNSTIRYDLLSRSFSFTVKLPDSLNVLETMYYHSAEWQFESGDNESVKI